MPPPTLEYQGTYFKLYVDYNGSNPQQWKVTAVRWTNDTPRTVQVRIINQVDGSVFGSLDIPPGEHSQLASVPNNWSVVSRVDPVDGQTIVDYGNFGISLNTV